MPVSEAVDHAVKSCIQDGILVDFLRKNRAEVVKMSIYEYDEEKHFKTLREEGKEEGRAEGREEGLKEGLQQGLQQGRNEGSRIIVARMFRKGKSVEDIAEDTDTPIEDVRDMLKAEGLLK